MIDKTSTYMLIGEALAASSEEMFVAEWATSSMFDPDPDGAAPDYDAVVAYLHDIWTAAHVTAKEVRKYTGLTQAAFARRFLVSTRTVECWESSSRTGSRECPRHLLVMMAQIVGMVDVL